MGDRGHLPTPRVKDRPQNLFSCASMFFLCSGTKSVSYEVSYTLDEVLSQLHTPWMRLCHSCANYRACPQSWWVALAAQYVVQ